MKILIALVLPVLAAGTLAAAAAPVSAVGRPLGAIYVPPPAARPLGGVALPTTPVRRTTPRTVAPAYYGPVYYIPNAYGTTYTDTSSSYAPPVLPAQPVIINQYFASKGSSIPDGVNTADTREPAPEEEAPLNPGDPLGPPTNYYLIRYKDRSTYSALTYWLEGDTLHYVTTQNTHNQASLSLIDIDQTYKLNADRSVPFSIPGK